MSERNEKIDRLIHDAEHAEAGADFAEMMASRDPRNPMHRRVASELREKARRLRDEAASV